jgi:RNA polymerase sigma-70 factor, ECF subfamily
MHIALKTKKGLTDLATLIADAPTILNTDLTKSWFAESILQQQEQTEVDMESEQRILVARALQGDTSAYDDIFDRYGSLMLRTAYSIVQDRDSAEDIVQNSLLLAWQHLPGLRETGALRPWLMRIVVNQCISLKRRIARSTTYLRQSFSEYEADQASQIADDAGGLKERTWDLAQAISQLTPKQQMVIRFHYYYGMTLPEISQKCQISENTLKKRLQAGLSHLRQIVRTAEMGEAM